MHCRNTGLCSQAVCIPVIFHNKSVLMDSLPYRDVIPYNDMVFRVPIMDELLSEINDEADGSKASPTRSTRRPANPHAPSEASAGQGQLMAHLRAVPEDAIRHKQALLRRYAPLLAYPYPKLQRSGSRPAQRAESGENAVTMAISKLAAALA